MSSSAIGFQTINKSPTGATGALGAQGPIGPTGGLGGPTGPTGNIAPYILNVSLTGQTATVELSDGTEYLVSGNFLGATSSDTTIISIKDPLDPGSDAITYSLLASGNNTNSFVMRGISGFGSLVVTENASTIFIDSIYTPSSGSLDSFGLTNNTLVYLKQRDQISSTTIGITSGNFYDGVLNFEKSGSTPASPSFSKLLPRSKVKYLTPTYKTSTPQPIVLNVDDAGVFYVRTPNGISAFNGNFKSSEVVSFTLITESDDIWNFPSNVYFENGENYLTCGKSILNLTSFDQGTSWYATVAARGVDASVTNCQIRGVLGSCCYTGVTGSQCVDYVTKNQCDILSGTFNPLQPCETACGYTFGICCSNGQCIEDANYAECLAFGGRFLFGVTCGSFGATLNPNGTNAERLCYDSCQNQKVACCKDGVCLGDEFTKIECENILGGVAFVGQPCSSVDCCEQNVKIGACCKNQECSQKTLNECKAIGGVFMGEGELCENINCKCIGEVRYGNCCYCKDQVKSCKVTTENECETDYWTYDSSYTSDTIPCNNSGIGVCNDSQLNCNNSLNKCCYCENGVTQCTNGLPKECVNLKGNYTIGVTCDYINGTLNNCDNCTSNNGGPCGDCETPGICCNCDHPSQKCIPIGNIKDCPEGYTRKTKPSCEDNACECNSGADCDNFRPVAVDNNTCLGPGISDNFVKGTASTAKHNLNLKIDNINSNDLILSSNSSVKDFYVNIKNQGFHYVNIDDPTSGIKPDLQFCFELDLSLLNQNNSMRIYILRTWYPKNFVQNYGAWREFRYDTDGTLSKIPYSTEEQDLDFSDNEITYWDRLEFGYKGVDRTNWLPQQKLSLYVDKDGNDKYYHNSNGYFDYFKTDVLRKQLNCPLYGINPRGKAMFTESENITKNGANFKTFISLLNNTIDASNNENTSYPEYGDWQGTRYYHSTNLGIRYIPDNIAPTEAQLTQNNLNIFPNDGFRYLKYNSPIATPTNGLTYFGSNNTTLKSPYLLYTKTFNKPYHTTTFENFQYKLFKFIGYTDEGIFSKNSDTGDIDFIQNQNVGFFLREMISNKFDNINYALKVGSIQPGHPLTVDYTAKYMEETSLGNNYTGNIIPRLNDGADDGIGDASALYKTPHEAIIFDSGCITRDGEFRIFDGFGISYGARQHYGAVGNPKDGLNSSGERLTQPRQAKVYGKYDRDRKSYNFCVTIPNWRDYIVDSDFADGTQSEANPYYQENLLESNNLDRKRFSDFFDSLRFVVFSNTDIIENRGITGPENIVDFYNENSNFSAKNLAKNYIMNQPPSESYKISFNNSSLCNPDSQQKQECLCTDYIPDWNSNCYAFAQTRDLCAYLTGGPKDCSFQYKTSIFGSGLGTISICSCIDNCSEVFAAGGCHHSMSVFCSCGDNQNCSCRGESFARPFYFCGNGEGGVSKCEGGCPGSGEDSCRFVLDQWAKISNSQIRKVFIGGNEYYLIKLPPVPGRNSAYVAGNKALNKDSLCGIETCSNPPSIDATNIEYIRIGLDDVFCGSENFCTKNKCIFPLATCNFNGTVEDNDAELSAVLDSINFATSIRACGGSSPFANIPVTELLTQYTDTPQGTCNTSFTDTFINKLIPIEGSEPLCIPLECSVIDCSQYEDCSPT